MKKLKVAQIGVGGFGAHRRLRMRQSGLFESLAACDLNPAALAECEKEDGARPVGTYEELLAFPDIEAVIICTGAKFHAKQVAMAVEAGLHVFVEKPLCSTPEELAALVDLQRRTDRVIAVGHADHRSDAISLTIKDMIDSGELGGVAAFEKTTAHGGGLQIQPGDWRGDPAKNPGGMLFQCGVHAIHELIFYFGPISEVSAMMRYDVHSTKTADVAICQLKFHSGVVGSLHAYHVTPYRHTFSVFGTRANIYRNERFFTEGTRLQIQRLSMKGECESEETLVPKSEGDLCGNLRSFYEAVRNNGTCYPSLADGARALQVVFAAEESAISNKIISVPEIDFGPSSAAGVAPAG